MKMTDKSIFTDDKTEEKTEVGAESTASESKIDLEIINKRLKDKDDFIEKLKRENEEMKNNLVKAKTIEDVLQSLQHKEDSGSLPSSDDLLRKVESLVEIKLSNKDKEHQLLERKRQEDTNASQVVQALSKAFGDNAEKAYVKMAQDVGKSVEEFNQMAKESPQVVLKLFETKKPTTASGTQYSGASVNSASLATAKTYREDPRFAELASKGDVQGILNLRSEFDK